MKKHMILLTILCMALFFLAACDALPSSGSSADAASKSVLGVSEVKIGLCTTTTGVYAKWGDAAKKGGQLAVKLLNENGGILNTPVKFVSDNDKGTASNAVKSIAKLIGGHEADVIIGGRDFRNMEAAQLIEKAGIPELIIGTNPDYLKSGTQYLFRTVPSSDGADDQLTEAMKDTKRTRIGFLVMEDQDCINAAQNLEARINAENGIKIVSEQTFPADAVGFEMQINAIMDEVPDGVVLITDFQYAEAIKELREAGFDGYIFSNEGASDLLSTNVGDAANGVVFYSPYVVPQSIDQASSEAETTMLKAYQDTYGELPQCESAYRVYDSVNIAAKAITDAQSLKGGDIIKALKNIKGYAGLAGEFDYADQQRNEGIKGQTIYIIYKGKIMEFFSDYPEAVDDITLEY